MSNRPDCPLAELALLGSSLHWTQPRSPVSRILALSNRLLGVILSYLYQGGRWEYQCIRVLVKNRTTVYYGTATKEVTALNILSHTRCAQCSRTSSRLDILQCDSCKLTRSLATTIDIRIVATPELDVRISEVR